MLIPLVEQMRLVTGKIYENDDPSVLTSISVPTTDIASATLSYNWQSRIGTNSFTDISGANSVTYDPSTLATTTDFRRVARSDFNGVQCIDIVILSPLLLIHPRSYFNRL